MRMISISVALAAVVAACGEPAPPKTRPRPTVVEGREGLAPAVTPSKVPPLPAADPNFRPPPEPPHVNDPVKGLSPAERRRLPFDPSGIYRRARPKGMMRIRSKSTGWQVYLEGEAEYRGDATPSTCTVLVYGYLDDRRLVGYLTEFRSDHHEVSYEALGETDGLTVVVFDERGANVVDRYGQNICGLHSNLDGYYRRE